MFSRVQVSKYRKEIPIQRSGVRNAGISQQNGEDRGERYPQHHPRCRLRGVRAVKSLDERADNKFGVLRLAPWHNSQDARLHGQIEQGDSEDREKNSARDISFWIADFSTKVANVVVAPIA